jgi:hypothetical protein
MAIRQLELKIALKLFSAGRLNDCALRPNSIKILNLVWHEGCYITDLGERFGLTCERGRQLYIAALEDLNTFLDTAFKDYLAVQILKEENKALKEQISQYKALQQQQERQEEINSIQLSLFDLTTRASNICGEYKLRTVGDLTRLTPDEFNRLRNCGKKTVKEMKYYLRSVKSSFKKRDKENYSLKNSETD